MTTTFILYKTPEKLQRILEILEEMDAMEVIGDSDEPDKAFAQITSNLPTMVLVEIGKGMEENISFIGRLNRAVPRMTILAYGGDLNSDTVIQAVHEGAKYFVKEPFEASSVRDLLERTRLESEVEEETKEGEGKVLTVFSNKGGLGKTTVASNLAVSLTLDCKKSVALVDLDLQFGDVSLFLDLHPTFTIYDLVSRIRELDRELIRSSMIKHETGVYVLTEPKMAEESDLITPDHVSKFVGILKRLFDYVVIDTTHSFDDVIIEALDISDFILLISVLDLPTIRNTQRCLEIFRKLNFSDEKVKIIVNRFMSEEEVDPSRFESALKFPIYWKIPNDYSTVISAINSGVPIQRLAPYSKIAMNFFELAAALTGYHDERGSDHKSIRIVKKVFSMMTRSRKK